MKRSLVRSSQAAPAQHGERRISSVEFQLVLLFATRAGIISPEQSHQLNREVYDRARKAGIPTDDRLHISVSGLSEIVRELFGDQAKERILEAPQLASVSSTPLLEPPRG